MNVWEFNPEGLGKVLTGRVLEAFYRAGSRWRVTLDGADWWSRGVGCYPIRRACG
jgi:hypothetical protein